jgi:serine/threonine-protein kinase
MEPLDLLASKYRMEHVLGSGAMGTVWAAVNESTGRPVAIKLIHGSTPKLRTRMLREARAVGTLKHTNIVDIYDAGETESGDPFLVMERLSGETLDERLKRCGRLPPAKAVEIAGSIAAALRLAHAKGIVHRDLKPANVFLHRQAEGEDEIVKVLDFGVSKHLEETTSTITAGLVGSPAYMSPEQARAEPNIDARSDLWSLGVVLFEMLAGRRPFPSNSAYLVITEVITGPIPSIAEVVPGLSPTLVHVVERCLTRDVNARVGSADELIWLLGPSLDVGPSSEAEPTSRQGAVPRSSKPTMKDLEGRSGSTDAGTTATRVFVREHAATVAMGDRSSAFGPKPTDAVTTATLVLVGQHSAATAVGDRSSTIGPGPTDAGTTAPLALVREHPAAITAGDRSTFGPVSRRGPSKAVVALVACAAALLTIVVFGVALRRAPPKAEWATSAAASTERPEATNTVAPSIPQPVVAMAPEAPASSEPATLPPLGKDEAMIVVDAPPTTAVSLNGKPIGTVPVAPRVVPAGSHRVFFKHPTLGERVMVVEVQAGETGLAAMQLGKDVGAPPRASPSTHRSGERRLVLP